MSAGRERRWGARAGIVLAGGAGALVAGRTAAFYHGTDGVACALSLLIGGGLAFGVVESLARVARVERVAAELAKLPRPATTEAVEACSAPLRAVLRARIAGTRSTVANAGFTSYLLGLLVMLGLLGTFLGLFEALRGARAALATSGDVDALRAALAGPMVGLSRAFGTSAAGVTASAMLGLAAVFARRVEAWLSARVNGYGDEALAPLTVAGRQLALLEALVQQQAEAARAAARASEAVEATAAALRVDVSAGVSGVAHSVEQALTPALERAVARASTVTRERLDEWSLVVARDADERQARDAALSQAWSNAAGQAAERVAREGARLAGELRDALGEGLQSLDARLGASLDALASQLRARAGALSDDLAARVAELTGAVGATVRGLSGQFEGTRARLDRTLEATTEALTRHAERALARERTHEQALDARAAALADAEGRAFARLEAHVVAVDAAVARHLERMSALSLEAEGAAARRVDALAEALRVHAEGLSDKAAAVLAQAERTTETAAAAVQRVAGAAEAEVAARAEAERAQAARADAVLSGFAAAAEQVASRAGHALAEQAARQADLEARVLAAHEASAARLSALLAQHAEGLGRGLDATRALVDEAAGLLRASGVEMGAAAEGFTTAVDRYRDASDACLSTLAGLDQAVDRAGKKAAVDLLTDYLDQTREVFEHSLEVQRELFAELRALRGRRPAGAGAEEPRVRA